MILVVAATQRELEGVAGAVGVRAAVCGIGPVEAAVRTAAALAATSPAVLLHVGIAGVRSASAISVLDTVIGTESIYCDADLARPLLPDPGLVDIARRALPAAHLTRIGTAGRVGGSHSVEVEAMEGYGVLRAAQAAGVATLEVRVVSNEIEEDDRRRWRFEEGFAGVAEVTRRLLAAIPATGAG